MKGHIGASDLLWPLLGGPVHVRRAGTDGTRFQDILVSFFNQANNPVREFIFNGHCRINWSRAAPGRGAPPTGGPSLVTDAFLGRGWVGLSGDRTRLG